MRIIGGEFGSRRIASPEGMATRPTQDRIREAIFSILQAKVPDSAVLDLFAGSGALGLEALSRGARYAFFADSAVKSIETVKRNIIALGVQGRSGIVLADYTRALDRLAKEGRRFDIVFLDPPYASGYISGAMEIISQLGLLNPDAVICAEHETPIDAVGGYVLYDTRRYGRTSLSFFKEDVKTG